MPRSPHYIMAGAGDSQPARLVCVSCDAVAGPESGQADVEYQSLDCWCALGWQRDHHGTYRDWSRCGASPADWHDCVMWAARRPGATWVVAYQCCQAMSLLDVWGAVERGQVCLDGHDAHGGGRPGARPGTRAGGYCCLEDPPTVVFTRVPGRPGRVVYLDCRNWGVECYPRALPCAERCAWLAGVMRRLVDTLAQRGWGALKHTAGSQALATWRRRYLTDAVHCHCDPVALELERTAYVGGRVECRRVGPVVGPIYHYDVRSMYPHVCVSTRLPGVLVATGSGVLPALPSRLAPVYGWIAEVALDTDEPAYPAVLQRPTVYPVGRFRTVLAGPELDDALQRGRVTSVGRWAQYYLSPCLRAYASAMYTWRCEMEASADQALAEVAKRLLVALPGKMGQRGWHWDDAPGLRPERPWMIWWELARGRPPVRLRSLGGWTQRERVEGWSHDAVGAVAAWICAAGRVSLLRGIRAAGWESVYYHDTDSLQLGPGAGERLRAVPGMCGDDLGQWRSVGCYASAHYYGQKHYRLGERVVCAGLPGPSCEPGPTTQHWWYRRGAKSDLVVGHRPTAARVLLPYTRAPRYSAGVVGPDGVVHPLERREW